MHRNLDVIEALVPRTQFKETLGPILSGFVSPFYGSQGGPLRESTTFYGLRNSVILPGNKANTNDMVDIPWQQVPDKSVTYNIVADGLLRHGGFDVSHAQVPFLNRLAEDWRRPAHRADEVFKRNLGLLRHDIEQCIVNKIVVKITGDTLGDFLSMTI
jgi:hypothetical protein